MLIGGIQELSLIDYPKKLSAIIFTQGCPFRCHFCHNPSLVLKEKFSSSIKEEDIFSFLKKRQNKLDAVVITGGEPTIQKDLKEFIKKVKNLGYLIKLDTSGINPHVLKELLDENLLDYVAMDIKTSLNNYSQVIAIKINIENIKKSINILLSSSIPYEFRTTLVPFLHKTEDVKDIATSIKGAKLLTLQTFIPTTTLNPNFGKEQPFSASQMKQLKILAEQYVVLCKIR